jgi:hypothetical protein
MKLLISGKSLLTRCALREVLSGECHAVTVDLSVQKRKPHHLHLGARWRTSVSDVVGRLEHARSQTNEARHPATIENTRTEGRARKLLCVPEVKGKARALVPALVMR